MMEIYADYYYKTSIRQNKKGKGYIGFIGKKVAFLPNGFKLPSYLSEGTYEVLGKYIEDKGNYFIINKIELPSMYDVIGVPKKAFKNTNTTLTILNNIPVKVSDYYIEFETNNNKCRISLFKRQGKNRNVKMTLVNINGHLNVLNDINPFKNGQFKETYFKEIVKILSCDYRSETMLYLVSELMWLNEELYQEVFQQYQEREDVIEEKGIIEELASAGYGWSIRTHNLNIPAVNKELYQII